MTTINDFIEKKESRLRDLLGIGSLTREGQIALMELRTAIREAAEETVGALFSVIEGTTPFVQDERLREISERENPSLETKLQKRASAWLGTNDQPHA